MDFTPYLREVDVELSQLKAVRRMLMELREPVLPIEAVAQRAPRKKKVVAEPEVVEPAPTLTVVPPKQRREYQRRTRAAAEPKAIGGTIPQGPVFVRPTVAVAAPVVAAPVELDAAALEAAVRRNLLGQVA